ncbi:MAG: transcription-repair coupling factor, partial [Riemerella sp.]|nr:transcription-repair coupling factor [Riemerella sp.]
MDKSLLTKLLNQNFGEEIFQNWEKTEHLSVKGAVGSAVSILAAETFLSQQKTILLITDDKEDSHYTTTEMEELVSEENVLHLPNSYTEPYQEERTKNANLVLRTEVINQLNINNKQKIIVAHISALNEKVLKKEDFKMISHRIKTGEKLDFDFTEELLNQFHFNLTDFVSEPGEFAVRGGIVDVFSYSNEKPFRITFFGNEIESIKTFDIETQLSVEKVDEFQLVSNINLSTQGEKVPFFDLLPSDSLIIIKNAYSCLDKIENFYQKAQNQFDKLSKTIKHREPHELFLSSDEFSKCFQKFRTIDFSNSPSSKIIQLSQTPQPSFHKNFELLIEDLITKKEQGYEVWISFSSKKQKDRLTEIIETLATEHQQDAVNHFFTAFQSELHEGFVDSHYKIAVYTDHQIFDRYQR